MDENPWLSSQIQVIELREIYKRLKIKKFLFGVNFTLLKTPAFLPFCQGHSFLTQFLKMMDEFGFGFGFRFGFGSILMKLVGRSERKQNWSSWEQSFTFAEKREKCPFVWGWVLENAVYLLMWSITINAETIHEGARLSAKESSKSKEHTLVFVKTIKYILIYFFYLIWNLENLDTYGIHWQFHG